jgi:hypothetical protein
MTAIRHGVRSLVTPTAPMQRPRFVPLAAISAVLLAISPDVRAGGPAELANVAPSLDPRVLELALRASSCAERRGLLATSDTLTVIDYTRPSTEPRLWVLDLARRALLHEELVAHGRGTGDNHAQRFSNDPGSHQSSLGLFVTLDTYAGKHGRSLRLQGLEAGVNDRALERAIVMHGAQYVADAFAFLHGRLGRSWGCPALAIDVAQRVIDRIRGGSPLFAYYPDPQWLEGSSFLGSCSDAQPANARERGAPPRS